MTTHFIRFTSRNALLGAATALFSMFGATGCYATVEARPAMFEYADGPVVWVDSAPASIETYPCEYYGGTPMYLVEGRWYYRSADRWAYYRNAPVELEQRRVVLEASWRRPGVTYAQAHVDARVHADDHARYAGQARPAPQPRVFAQPRVGGGAPAHPHVHARR